ncbi:hypothetical protein C2845_PM04G12630 [Panicum miliaceum]|uniref:RNase H type-1 domain-containing protein n=1 Tax=Panicum miliaceum TaxID=4540 RepID=A0A3L6QU16_PANMI|nr:hypothetical protein C2845_PM04G12630 [Panicum miliaceum]
MMYSTCLPKREIYKTWCAWLVVIEVVASDTLGYNHSSNIRCRLRWVSELLDIDGRSWDFDKLIQIFNPADAEEIAKIKIPNRLPEDFIAWHSEKSDVFSVRSAYNSALRIKREGVHAQCALQTSLSEVCTSETNGSGKGKKPCSSSGNTRSPEAKSVWEPPSLGWVKFNVDGSFVSQSGDTSVGVVTRDSDGRVVLTAWRALFRCLDVVEAQAQACLEGFRLAAQWAQGPAIIESDCARIVQAMKEAGDRSATSFIMAEAKDQVSLLVDWQVAKVKRESNLEHLQEV